MPRKTSSSTLIPVDQVQNRILMIRGQRVILDADLAFLYGVTTKRLNEAVKRNVRRFPEDFVFQLTPDETESLRSQIATSKTSPRLRSQFAASKGRGGRRYAPFAFTEYGPPEINSLL